MSEVTAVPLRPIAKGSLTKLWAGILLLGAIGVGAAYYGTYRQVAMAQSPEDFLAANAKHGGVVTTASGLQYEVLDEGNGPKPGPNDIVLVEYEGKLVNGDVFDGARLSRFPRNGWEYQPKVKDELEEAKERVAEIRHAYRGAQTFRSEEHTSELQSH